MDYSRLLQESNLTARQLRRTPYNIIHLISFTKLRLISYKICHQTLIRNFFGELKEYGEYLLIEIHACTHMYMYTPMS